MSQWTHVAGCIRIDDLESIMYGTSAMSRIAEAFRVYPLPEGSEGPIQVKIVETREHESALSWGLAYVWGDLRDYDDAQEVFAWAKDVCAQLFENRSFVRQCAIVVDIEFGARYIIHGREDKLTMTKLEDSDGD